MTDLVQRCVMFVALFIAIGTEFGCADDRGVVRNVGGYCAYDPDPRVAQGAGGEAGSEHIAQKRMFLEREGECLP